MAISIPHSFIGLKCSIVNVGQSDNGRSWPNWYGCGAMPIQDFDIYGKILKSLKINQARDCDSN